MAPNNKELPPAATDAAVATPESSEKMDMTSESFQSSVRDELENIVLALIIRQPMCGTEIIKTIHARFGLLLSPGTIYPLLHGLEKRGLLQHEHGTKAKTYKPAKGMKEKIRGMLDEHVKARNFLNRFLLLSNLDEDRQSTLAGSTRGRMM